MSCRALFVASTSSSNWLGILLRQSSTVIRAIGFRLSVYRSRQKKQKSQQTLTVNTPERLALNSTVNTPHRGTITVTVPGQATHHSRWLAKVGAGTYEGTNFTGETPVKETPFTARRN